MTRTKTRITEYIPKHILLLIIISQFCCTSLWFAGNGVMDELIQVYHLDASVLSFLTSAVQFGFILGTFVFAVFTISDRYSPSKVFMVSAFLAALFNCGLVIKGQSLTLLLILRFLTGFFLAGIYPVGMKIAADYYNQGLGKALGFLVGALVLGTAFPHLLSNITQHLPWETVIYTTSILSVLGGCLIFFFVPNGPFRKSSIKVDFTVLFKLFKNKAFKAAAFGYFGHMWELYAFWAFTPILIKTYNQMHPEAVLNISFISFLVIGSGCLSCAFSGIWSKQFGVKRSAFYILLVSAICCIVSPLSFYINSEVIFVAFLIFWGLVVVADSPLFSTLVAHNTAAETKGSALTIVNCIGFIITIISIQTLGFLQSMISNPTVIYLILAIGPIFGLVALKSKHKENESQLV
ncbi:major facilitator superfamily permease [Formosa agariphila KMM 3901]|uniref:Major facilitator superfamily permease n=1 Tax=Formosa agariphila (strain DSM 15362 / KCTC 12365 / LMG 23005 / KMM 3901 / M-2Alg 35-1) TaxID=1347342 RepID=T2KIB9_FORAG|nr:MFS transporter [Formosa agariphila]CDF78178.1 major facilitator superfamily permease [Formosa agariphila KMM 3901]